MMYRPGPPSLHPGLCPGGWVIHVYGLRSGRLVGLTRVGPDVCPLDQLDGEAERFADETVANADPGDGFVIVCYDGDSGARSPVPGFLPGERLA